MGTKESPIPLEDEDEDSKADVFGFGSASQGRKGGKGKGKRKAEGKIADNWRMGVDSGLGGKNKNRMNEMNGIRKPEGKFNIQHARVRRCQPASIPSTD